MREILFRGKRLDNGEWVTGSPWVFSPPMQEAVIIHGLGTVGEDDGHTRYSDTYRVDPSTVGQYTGFRDCNGRKAFDGDIIRFGQYNLLVWWNDEAFQWQARKTLSLPCSTYNLITRDVWDNIDLGYIAAEVAIFGVITSEVIGNIYDNPELLKGSEGEDEQIES